MEKITWILKPDLINIDIDNLHNYGPYEDECLISTFYINEILDFLEYNNITSIKYSLIDKKYYYVLSFSVYKINFNKIFDKMIKFETGRFKTKSIYIKTSEKILLKLWKKRKFYNKHLLEVKT